MLAALYSRHQTHDYVIRQSLFLIRCSVAGSDIEQLNKFPCGGYSDESTIVYLQHPCKILTSLEVIHCVSRGKYGDRN